MVKAFARIARFLIVALLACVSTAISAVPGKAVPIARGLPALAVMLEEASSQKSEPISYSKCSGAVDLPKLVLLTTSADDRFDLSNRSGGASGSTP